MSLEPTWIYPNAPTVPILLLVTALSVLVFVLAGLSITLPLLKRKIISTHYFSILTILASCTLGYLLYWLFIASPALGKIGCAVIYIACFSAGIQLMTKRNKTITRPVLKFFFISICLSLVVSVFYNSILFSCTVDGKISPKNQFCSLVDTTFDNTLPLSFALAAYNNVDKPVVSDWKASDRPPLQSGLALMQLPLASWLRVGTATLNYQIFACFLQCLWLIAVIEFIRLQKIARKYAPQILAIAITNYFVFVNSIFVWPKLLAGSLVVFGFLALADSLNKKDFSYEAITIIGLGSVLGFVSHTGAVFTLAPMFILGFVLGWRFISMAKVVYGAVLMSSLYAPWFLYSSIYFPSGDRLTKWWIGGQVDIDDRSLSQTLKDSYSSISLRQLISYKLGNVKSLVGVMQHTQGPVSDLNTVGTIFNLQGSYFIPSFSFALFGLAVLFRKPKQIVKQALAYWKQRSVEMLALLVGGLALILWLVLSYGPPAAPTISYAGSYATFILIFISLLTLLSRLEKLLNFVAITSSIYFLSVIYVTLTTANATIRLDYVLLCFLALAPLGIILNSMRHSLETSS